MNLVRAEWSRLFARRFTKIMMGGILLVMLIIGLGFAANTNKITEADHAAARAQIAEQQRYFDQMVTECKRALEAGDTSGKYPPNCEYGDPGFREEYYLRYQFNFRNEIPSLVLVAAGVLALFGFVVGASFVGAEWNSGGMMNLLLWRPRRVPVLAAKLGTMLLGVLAAAAVYLVLWVSMFWAIGQTRGARNAPGISSMHRVPNWAKAGETSASVAATPPIQAPRAGSNRQPSRTITIRVNA